jgi:hypothetical protein
MDALVEIKRFEHDIEEATRGAVFLNGDYFGFSLERPKRNNLPFISRINTGEYTARKVYSKKRGWFWLLDDANGRTEIILFHPGSYMRNFKGCIGLGNRLWRNKRTGDRMILNTRKMCRDWMKATENFNVMKVIIT